MGVFFGTDGIRGVACEELTYDLAYKCGNALAMNNGKPKIIIGRDTRCSGSYLSTAFALGAMSAGADVIDIVNIDQYMVLFCFQAHIGSCIILLATEEGHVTISDQRNMGRSSNCPFSAEAEKKPMEKYPVSLLCYRKYKRSQSPSVLS